MRVNAINTTMYNQKNYGKTMQVQHQNRDKMQMQGNDTSFKGLISGAFGATAGSILGLLVGGPIGYFVGLAGGTLIGHYADEDGNMDN